MKQKKRHLRLQRLTRPHDKPFTDDSSIGQKNLHQS